MAKNLPQITTDYLNFSAGSIKNLIVKKLGENPHFTDQIFEDSNLTTLIDIFAYQYQATAYYLNHGAAESNFADSSLYENMNRLVKLLGYNPRGYATSVVEATAYGLTGAAAKILPKYTQVQIRNKRDSSGKNIFFTTTDYYYIYPDSMSRVNNILMYNGNWKLYNRTFVANGIPNEVFVLQDLVSDTDQDKYVGFPFVDVFVKRRSGSTISWHKFSAVETGLFLNQGDLSVYKPDDKVFALRLNENKAVTLQFGDGIYGEKLQYGDEIYPVYLESNGPTGVLGANSLSQSSTTANMIIGIAGMTQVMFDEIFATEKAMWVDRTADLPSIYVVNQAASSTPTVEESVDEIRTNAPSWFKSVGIIRSTDEIENFIKRNYYANVDSVKVMNNWGYLSSFMRWLYNLEKSTGNSYINNNLSTRWDYVWSDPADSNNAYIFLKMKEGSFVSTKDIDKKIQRLKCLTMEPIYLTPLTKYFIPCAYRDAAYSINDWDTNYENYIEILTDENALTAPETIRSRACDVITQFFASENNEIGQLLNFDQLNNDLFEISGIKRIRTIFKPTDPTKNEVIMNGLHFIAWTSDVVRGVDEDLVGGNYQLEAFSFPAYLEPEVSNRVKIITDSIVSLQAIEY